MALILYLKYAENLRGKADRLAKVTFRGVAHHSSILEGCEAHAVFDCNFQWPVARPINADEFVDVHIFNYNKYRSNRLVASFRMMLQQLIEVGHLSICDSLIDENNVVTQSSISFDVSYNAPDGSVGMWSQGMFDAGLGDSDETSALLEPQTPPLSTSSRRISSALGVSGTPAKAFSTAKNLVKKMKFGKQRATADDFRKLSIDSRAESEDNTGVLERLLEERFTGAVDDDSNEDLNASSTGSGIGEGARFQTRRGGDAHKAQDFQVCLTILEARQLAGLNMDPVVCVQVGDQKKYTSVKESTNCPYYNEYFVFDFRMPPAMLFDRIITLTVLQSRTILRASKLLGSFKLDVGTVYYTPDHQFHHKWALLNDPDDINGGPKGYLKCDIAVVGKGDSIKTPPKNDKHDDDDIEANLLLPLGVPAERQRARFVVKIFRAEGLPRMNTGLMANVQRAFTGNRKDLADPYVQVSFAGHKCKSSVKTACYAPVWNEQVVFTEMFPPLCRRVKIQLRDSDSVNSIVIGTHFLDFGQISNEGGKGFLPTFGPCWVNLYGSTRSYSLLEEHSQLNEGLGEGASYRGRILIAFKTELLDPSETGPSMVELESCAPPPENWSSRTEEFFLLGVLLEAGMIERKVSDRSIKFELSIGNSGNDLDGQCDTPSSDQSVVAEEEEEEAHEDDDAEEEAKIDELTRSDDAPDASLLNEPTAMATTAPAAAETSTTGGRCWVSTTTARKAATKDKYYYSIPYEHDKPVLWVKGRFEDYRRRMVNANLIEKIADFLDDGLSEVQSLLRQERPGAEKQLRAALGAVAHSCSLYQTSNPGRSSLPTAGRTRLDKERSKLCLRQIEQIGLAARSLRSAVKTDSLRDKLRAAQTLLTRLRNLAIEPQDSLPDVFVWMIANNKRIAYQRMPARELLYAAEDDMRGRFCGKVRTLMLSLPGKRGSGVSGWLIQAKLEMYIWLGLSKHRKYSLNDLPLGYEDTPVLRRICRMSATPPKEIRYVECHAFQLRAHIYQARSLIGSDASGLSDPFARIVICQNSLCTRVIDETLSPTWDEMLIFNQINIYGRLEEVQQNPPNVVIEIFDQDRVGKSEFIGRSMAHPVVKLSHQRYEAPCFPPALQWYDVYRGSERAGQLLAAFELLQLSSPGDAQGGHDLPPVELPEVTFRDCAAAMPVPLGIRPTLSKHRIEVLFWGVRDLRRIQFTSVDRPRIDIECAGNVLSSSVIQNAKKNPNFTIPVKSFDVELPDHDIYCPPISIRCIDIRNFGRDVLVGTHVINNISKFMYVPTTKKDRRTSRTTEADAYYHSRLSIPSLQTATVRPSVNATVTRHADDVTVTVENERLPLLATSSEVVVDMMSTMEGPDDGRKKKKKKKRKEPKVADEEDEPDPESLDWWSKYLASQQIMQQSLQEQEAANADETDDERAQTGGALAASSGTLSQYGAIPGGALASSVQLDSLAAAAAAAAAATDTKKTETKRAFKCAARAAQLAAAKLSPKSLRKQEKVCSKTARLMIFRNELEQEELFDGFSEWLHTFELYRGKKTGDAEDDESRVVGKFKGSLKIYKIPLPADIEDTTITGGDPQYGLFQGLATNDPVHVLVRVYVVKANDLHPQDLNGKADPYIIIRLGRTTINDKENYISKQLNPVFGKCFEVQATFPLESSLRVQLYDWDLVGADDLIGETVVDLENRFFSRHRATCGLAAKYETDGYGTWRDPMKPSQILARLCKDGRVDPPLFAGSQVRVANRVFSLPPQLTGTCQNGTAARTLPAGNAPDQTGDGRKVAEEHLALAVLHHWQEIPKIGAALVPEHVEMRSLYNPDKPGIEQGTVEMWVDLFPMDMPSPGPAVDISPRKPKSYELRCIIWNTDDVVLEDDAFFSGEKMSDIYVKGWIKGPDDMQSTDIHYRSLTGEGNFNWRFIFPFDYLVAEEKIVITRKETVFSWDETESKVPARLNLQVWDADHFSADDFLGALTLDLNRFPRGAKSSKKCSLDMLKGDKCPQMSLFKHKRVKGWWPFHARNEEGCEDSMELTGKVEAELHLLTSEEAERHPSGLARNEPDPLDKPNRPDSSFIWFLNPLKSIRYILWHNYKWVIIKVIIFLFIALLLALFFYNIPGYSVKKMMGA